MFISANNVSRVIHGAGDVMDLIKNRLDFNNPNSNKMVLNLKKSKCMVFKTNRTRIEMERRCLQFSQ